MDEPRPGAAAGSGGRGGAPDTGIACLALLLRFHGMAADPAQPVHEYALASGGVGLLEPTRAAREQGLEAGVRRLVLDRLDRAALPAIAEAVDGGFFVLARADGEKVLVQRPGAPPETPDRAALAARWTGRALLLARQAQIAQSAPHRRPRPAIPGTANSPDLPERRPAPRDSYRIDCKPIHVLSPVILGKMGISVDL